MTAAHSEHLDAPNSMKEWTRNWILLLIVSWSVSLAMLGKNLVDPDLWGHVLYGQEVLEAGQLPEYSTWNFTTPRYPWINHEHTAELLIATADSAGGAAGLLLLKFTVTVALLGMLTWHFASRGLHPATIGIVLLVMSSAIEFHWHFRPPIFGYFLFAGMLILLDRCFAGWAGENWILPGIDPAEKPREPAYSPFRMRLLYLVVPLMAVWVNTHESFAEGVVIGGMYLGLRAIESVVIWKSWGRFRRFVLVGIGMMAAIFINPYHYRLPLWVAEDIYLPHPEVTDWMSLNLLSEAAIPFWIIVVMSVAAWRQTRRIDLTHTVILLLLAGQAMSHRRYLAILGLAWTVWMDAPIDLLIRTFWAKIARHLSTEAPVDLKPANLVTVGLLACMAYFAAIAIPRWTNISVDVDAYPVAAMQYLADEELSGRTVVTFNWSQYALACFDATHAPSKGAMDGRNRSCYPQEIIDIYRDFVLGDTRPRFRSPNSPPIDPSRALVYENPELVLIGRDDWIPSQTLQQHSDKWVILYQDSLAQIWGRKDLFDNPASPRYVSINRRHVSEDLQQGSISWPALPKTNKAPVQIVSAQ